jgi:hypothetical protein
MRSGQVTRTSVIGTAVGSVFLGIAFGVAAVSSHREASALDANGLLAEAEVIAVDADHVTVVFATSDRGRVQTEFSDFRVDPRPEPGTTMQVRYDPADPYRHIQDARLTPDFVGAWLLAAASLALPVFGLYLAYIFWPLIGTRWP